MNHLYHVFVHVRMLSENLKNYNNLIKYTVYIKYMKKKKTFGGGTLKGT